VNKSFRLTRSIDFKRVRLVGKAYSHPLVVLFSAPGEVSQTRVGITAGKRVGGAVKRNRAKRLLREATRLLYPKIHPGNDLLLIARDPLYKANLLQTRSALENVLFRAKLITINNDNHSLLSQ
jgi:ribonuclease P protein component